MIFKVGDIVKGRDDLDSKFYQKGYWFSKCYPHEMTIRKIVEERNRNIIRVKENGYLWIPDWLEKIENDFLNDEDFKI